MSFSQTVFTYNSETKAPFTQETFNSFSGSVLINIPAGEVVNFEGSMTIPSGTILTIKGMEGETKATFPSNSIVFAASSTGGSLNYENLYFTGGSIYAQSDNANSYIDKVSFTDCDFFQITNNLVVLKASSGTLNNLTIEKCFFNECPTSSTSDDLIRVYDPSTMNNVLINNSSFRKIPRSLINNRIYNMVKLTISNCTFNEYGSSQGFIHLSTNLYPTNGLDITNCIFGKTNGSGINGITIKKSLAQITIVNSYTTSDCVFSTNPIVGNTTTFTTYPNTASNLFTDPGTGNFKIKDVSFVGKDSAGDPRYYFNIGTNSNTNEFEKNDIIWLLKDAIKISADIVFVKVFNINGQLILQSTNKLFSTDTWDRGVYVLQVEADGHQITQKYLK